MTKEQQRNLVRAWNLQSKILQDIKLLAHVNFALAYGCIRTAESMVDTLYAAEIRQSIERAVNASKSKGEGE